MSRRPRGLGAARTSLATLLGLSLAALWGCASAPEVPPGRFSQPARYPDRSTPEGTLRTFLWAWRTGDLAVLDQALVSVPRLNLKAQVEKLGREATAAELRKSAEAFEVREVEWIERRPTAARARVLLQHGPERSQVPHTFALLSDRQIWRISRWGPSD